MMPVYQSLVDKKKNGQKSFAVLIDPDTVSPSTLHETIDLANDGGIMDLWVREARIFKYGSGVGTNFSNLRGEGEKLSGGRYVQRFNVFP